LQGAIEWACVWKWQKDLEKDKLEPHEWEQLNSLMDSLKRFSDCTKVSEGRFATVEKVLPTMEFLLEFLEPLSTCADPFLQECALQSWKKLRKYYDATDRAPAFVGAIVMCPQYKWKYFKDCGWLPSWITAAENKVQNLWNTQYKILDLPASSERSAAIEESQGSDENAQKTENSFLEWQKLKFTTPRTLLQDEYQQYIAAPVIQPLSGFDPLQWWQEATQRSNYPRLSKMALDLLSIPAMSAEVERLFSSANITISDRRNRIGIDAVEAIECLKSWLRRNNISWLDSDVEELVRKVIEEDKEMERLASI
jgi:hypothetical protein